MSAQEAAAVRDALKAELGRERRRSLLRDIVMMLVGAGLGSLLARLW